MSNMSKRDLERIDLELQRYKTIDNKIYLRRQELIYNKRCDYSDSNKRRGNKVNKPTENIIISFDQDITLRNLEAMKLLIETLMSELIDSDLMMFKMRYLGNGMTWEEVAYELNKSMIYINRRRKVIAQKFIELKGF